MKIDALACKNLEEVITKIELLISIIIKEAMENNRAPITGSGLIISCQLTIGVHKANLLNLLKNMNIYLKCGRLILEMILRIDKYHLEFLIIHQQVHLI